MLERSAQLPHCSSSSPACGTVGEQKRMERKKWHGSQLPAEALSPPSSTDICTIPSPPYPLSLHSVRELAGGRQGGQRRNSVFPAESGVYGRAARLSRAGYCC